jgi:hypothetical protein
LPNFQDFYGFSLSPNGGEGIFGTLAANLCWRRLKPAATSFDIPGGATYAKYLPDTTAPARFPATASTPLPLLP